MIENDMKTFLQMWVSNAHHKTQENAISHLLFVSFLLFFFFIFFQPFSASIFILYFRYQRTRDICYRQFFFLYLTIIYFSYWNAFQNEKKPIYIEGLINECYYIEHVINLNISKKKKFLFFSFWRKEKICHFMHLTDFILFHKREKVSDGKSTTIFKPQKNHLNVSVKWNEGIIWFWLKSRSIQHSFILLKFTGNEEKKNVFSFPSKMRTNSEYTFSEDIILTVNKMNAIKAATNVTRFLSFTIPKWLGIAHKHNDGVFFPLFDASISDKTRKFINVKIYFRCHSPFHVEEKCSCDFFFFFHLFLLSGRSNCLNRRINCR